MAIMLEPMRYGLRLKKAMEHAGLQQEDLAVAASIKQPSVSYLMNKSKATGSEHTVAFAIVCGVNPLWLYSGEGEMVDLAAKDKGKVAPVVAYPENIQATIDIMLKLNEGKQGYVLKAVVDTVKELTTPVKKEQPQKVAGQTGK